MPIVCQRFANHVGYPGAPSLVPRPTISAPTQPRIPEQPRVLARAGARLDDAVDGRSLVRACGEGDVRVRGAGLRTMQVKVLGAVGHIVTDGEYTVETSAADTIRSLMPCGTSGVVLDPVLQVPAVLEERPHVVLVVHEIARSAVSKYPVEEAARAIELVAIARGPDIEPAHRRDLYRCPRSQVRTFLACQRARWLTVIAEGLASALRPADDFSAGILPSAGWSYFWGAADSRGAKLRNCPLKAVTRVRIP